MKVTSIFHHSIIFLKCLPILAISLITHISLSNTLMAQNRIITHIDWQVAAQLPKTEQIENQLGVAGPIVGILNDRLLVAGGANFPNRMPWDGGSKQLYDEVYLFEKDKNGNIFSLKTAQKLPFKVAYATTVSVDKGIVFIGGDTENGLSKKAVLLQFEKNSIRLKTSNLPDLPFGLANAAALTIGDKIYLVGGETDHQEVADALLMFDFKAKEKGWQPKARLPKKLSHMMFVGNNEHLYIIGGRKRNAGSISDLSASVYCYNVKKDEWTEKTGLPYALSAGTALALENEILIFGGDKGHTFHKAELMIAAVNNETDSVKKQIFDQIKIDIQTNHPGFSAEVLRYDTQVDTWNAINLIEFNVPVTTQAVKWGEFIIIPTGEIKAGVRTKQILKGIIK